MSVTGMIFLFLFLPLSLSIYYLANDSAKEYVLLGLSLLFYSIGSPGYIFLFIIAIFITVIIGRSIGHSEKKPVKKTLMIIGILLNAGILIFYKYYGPLLSVCEIFISAEVQTKEILLPLGISFYAFKAISYLADIYNGKAFPAGSPFHDALYLSIFTQIGSGPLTRYREMERTEEGKQLFSEGAFRFVVGFNKKILIANVLSNVSSEVFSASFGDFSRSYAWLGSICFMLQLYFDFSGYSDMAVGLTEMFGYRCRENFIYPYMSGSVSEFWRRWHISLGEWFRDYIYIPMGGSRTSSKGKNYFNLLTVWILTGLWHGSSWNFVIWGIINFLVIAIERETGIPDRFRTKIGKALYRIFVIVFSSLHLTLFHSTDLLRGLRYLRRMIVCKPNHLADLRTVFLLKDYAFFIIAAVIFCFPVIPFLRKKSLKNKTASIIVDAAIALVAAGAFIWAISFVVAGQNNPFIYANF